MKNLRISGWAVIFTVTVLLAACAPHEARMADTTLLSGPDVATAQPEDQKQLLERRENALVINQAWLDERQAVLDQRESDLERQENALAIQQAWLNERETRLAQGIPDLTKQDEKMAFQQAWQDDRQMLVAEPGLSQTKVEAGRCYASVFIPAQYRTVAVTKPIEVPKGETLPILYQTVTEQVKVSDERVSWEEILCEDDKTEGRIIEVQRALCRGGYNPGPIDGVLGKQTMAAVNDFQKDYNLTVANHLTVETVEALDVNF